MEPTLGQIIMFAGNFAPRGWALCAGQILPINQNQALYSILGTTYGGDGRTTFALPDLRGRAAIHRASSSDPWEQHLNNPGFKAGEETNTIDIAHMPTHHHAAPKIVSTDPPVKGQTGGYIASHSSIYASGGTDAQLKGNVTSNTGGGQPHNNMQPSLAINYIIALQGVFPSRS